MKPQIKTEEESEDQPVKSARRVILSLIKN